jgi:hypothetical protein
MVGKPSEQRALFGRGRKLADQSAFRCISALRAEAVAPIE